MSLQPRPAWEVPDETRRVAHAAFPNGNLYVRIYDELGEVYTDSMFADLFPGHGQPAESPGRLALITVMQFSEGLSDRQAADAVRGRIDWKYALGLELTDPGFHYSVLSEFRARLIAGSQEHNLLDVLLDVLKRKGLLKARGRQRTDSTHVLAAIRMVNRLELVGETMRRALNELADLVPDWLKQVVPLEWFTRYGQRFDSLRLPKGQTERDHLIEQIGIDGLALFTALHESPFRAQLSNLPGVEVLRQVWVQQFWMDNAGGEADENSQGQGRVHVRLRTDDNQPPGDKRIHSPYDPEARYSAKRSTEWVGYKAVITETCEDDAVHLITHVETTSSVMQDISVSDTIHAALARKDLLPSEHLMDAGFVSGVLLVEAKHKLGVEVCGPVKADVKWQAGAGQGYALSDFVIDWEAKTATCPQGQRSSSWDEQRPRPNRPDQPGHIQVKFRKSVCEPCSAHALCTRSKRGLRTLTLRPQAEHVALQRARTDQVTSEFRKRYAKRSGIEGTISQGVRAFDLRRTRYIGLAKTGLQMIGVAAAINLHRLFDWVSEIPRAVTRVSSFAALSPDPALVPTTWRA